MSETVGASRASLSISEGDVSRHDMVFTDRDSVTDKIRLTSRNNGDGTIDYALESPIEFRRLEIADALTQPLDLVAGWADVQRGLKQISYPHRVIKRMSRIAGNLTHLGTIQHDAGALARAMDEHDVRSVNIPVFGYGDSRQYAARRLRELDKDVLKLMIEQLLKVKIDSKMMRKWTPRQWNRRTSEQQQRQIETFRALLSGETNLNEVYGEDRTDENEARIKQDILDCLMVDELEDLEHTAAELLFDRFTIEEDLAWNPDDHMGEPPTETYIRDADVPKGVSRDKDTTVILGRHLAPKNRHNPLDRRRVEFWTEKPRRIVRPVLRWTRDDRGDEPVRNFRFGGGESRVEYTDDGLVVAHHSPLLGAAIAAFHFGEETRYDDALRRYFKVDQLSKRHAGLLPLVVGYEQNDVLSVPYVRMSENLIDEKVG